MAPSIYAYEVHFAALSIVRLSSTAKSPYQLFRGLPTQKKSESRLCADT
jgi:hypothetical protein